MSTTCPHCGAHHGFGAAQLEGHGLIKSDPNIERIADLERQLAEKQAEIEAMRPVVERYRWLRSNDQAPSITGIWYGDFTLDKAIDDARKQP